ncbi:MAG: hypothetical protein OEZ58_19935, partial [Gammaproteobacteria bacterium]|nr:hypothetical protein [Gammaproteobacteria bacterium]
LQRRLRKLFFRARPDKTELDILHGVLSAAQGRKYQWMAQQGLLKNDPDAPTSTKHKNNQG